MAVRRRINRDPASAASFNEYSTAETLESLIISKGITRTPLDIFKLAEELDLAITEEVLDNDLSGKLIKNHNGKWSITVNSLHSINRQRFTIAHEIAHYCLHRYQNRNFEDMIFFRGGEQTKEEFQANRFASDLLMPEKIFREQVSNGNSQIENLATHFGVSTLAVRVRAKDLGFQGHGL